MPPLPLRVPGNNSLLTYIVSKCLVIYERADFKVGREVNFLFRHQVVSLERLEMCRLCLFSLVLFIIFIILFIGGTQSAVVGFFLRMSFVFSHHEYLIFNSVIQLDGWMDGRTGSFWRGIPPASVTTPRTAYTRFPRDLLRRRRHLIFMHGVSAALIHHSSSAAAVALPRRRPPDVFAAICGRRPARSVSQTTICASNPPPPPCVMGFGLSPHIYIIAP